MTQDKMKFNAELPAHVSKETPLFNPDVHQQLTDTGRRTVREILAQTGETPPPFEPTGASTVSVPDYNAEETDQDSSSRKQMFADYDKRLEFQAGDGELYGYPSPSAASVLSLKHMDAMCTGYPGNALAFMELIGTRPSRSLLLNVPRRMIPTGLHSFDGLCSGGFKMGELTSILGGWSPSENKSGWWLHEAARRVQLNLEMQAHILPASLGHKLSKLWPKRPELQLEASIEVLTEQLWPKGQGKRNLQAWVNGKYIELDSYANFDTEVVTVPDHVPPGSKVTINYESLRRGAKSRTQLKRERRAKKKGK